MSTTDPHNEEHADGIVEDREQAPPVYFNILFYGLINWAVIFLSWFLFSGWSSHDEFEEKMAAHTGTPVAETPALSNAEGPVPSTTEGPASTNAEGPADTTTSAAPAVASAAVNASALYADKCAGCHGAKGEGAFGPDLTASSYKYGRGLEAVNQSIAKGRPKSMPAFAGTLSPSEVDALTSYILAL